MTELGSESLADADRLARRGGFGVGAERYDRLRPGYPAALVDAIAEYGRLGSSVDALDVGAGTGKATDALVARGWRTTAVELDAAMAGVISRRHGGAVRVEVAAFEGWASAGGRFDVAVCATAFHWLDPALRVDRLAAVLRPGGTAAVVWTRHVRGGTQAFFDAAQACYAAWTDADPAMRLPTEDSLDEHTEEFARSPRFEDVRSVRFPVEIPYATADYLDLISTYSETIALDARRRSGLLDCVGRLIDSDFGGRVVKRYVFDLVLARKVGGSR